MQSPTHSPTPATRSIPWHLAGPGLIAIAFGFMTWASWRRWPDLLVDFGQQLYVPWVLTEGQVLYRDVVYFHGPLASYLNALVFKLFGPGMLHLAILNLILVFAFSLFLFHWMRQISDAPCATVASLAFVLAFAFAYYWGSGLLNFITPYVYDLTYGFMLGCVALYQLYRYTLKPSTARLSAIGLLLGLVFLTKMEVFLATSVSLFVCLLVDARQRAASGRALVLRLLLVGLCAFVPVFLFVIYLSFHMPIGDAIYHPFSSWIHGMNPRVRGLFYYKLISGTLFLKQNLIKIGVHLIVYGAIVFLLIIVNRGLDKRGLNTPRVGLYTALVIGAALILLYNTLPWRHLTRSFPVILIVICGWMLFRCIRPTGSNGDQKKDLAFLTLSVFALAFTFKAFLNLNVSHTGFVLALPATLVILILLLNRLPRYLESHNHEAWVFRSASYSFITVTVMIWMSLSYPQYQIKTYPAGKGADMIYDLPPSTLQFDGTPLTRARITKQALAFMEQEVGPDETLLTLPDAMMINYLLRRRFSTRDTILNPLVWIIRGDAAVTQLLEQNPPDYVAYVGMNFVMFGSPVFGRDFARDVTQWIGDHYTLLRQFGKPPFSGKGFGIQVWKRKDADIPTAKSRSGS